METNEMDFKLRGSVSMRALNLLREGRTATPSRAARLALEEAGVDYTIDHVLLTGLHVEAVRRAEEGGPWQGVYAETTEFVRRRPETLAPLRVRESAEALDAVDGVRPITRWV